MKSDVIIKYDRKFERQKFETMNTMVLKYNRTLNSTYVITRLLQTKCRHCKITFQGLILNAFNFVCSLS